MRPIDADALFEVIKKSMAENPHKEETQRAMHIHEHKYFLTLLTSFPTIQPEPKEGEWIPVHPLQGDDPGAYMCSKCKTGMWEIRPSAYHYCPNCGAHMRGEKDG